jgi:hypothetical protein
MNRMLKVAYEQGVAVAVQEAQKAASVSAKAMGLADDLFHRVGSLEGAISELAKKTHPTLDEFAAMKHLRSNAPHILDDDIPVQFLDDLLGASDDVYNTWYANPGMRKKLDYTRTWDSPRVPMYNRDLKGF